MVDWISLMPAILAIIIGLVILIWPKILNVAVAIYFLVIGILKLLVAFGVLSITIGSLALMPLL